MNNMQAKYNEFYKGFQKKSDFEKIDLRSWPRNRYEAIIYSAESGETVLDIGCGNGYLLYQLQDRFTTLYGLEYSPHRLEQARVNLSGLQFIPLLGSAEHLKDITTNSMDCVISADTIEHIPDVYAACAEIYRVLKPGGRLVINTPNVAFIKKRFLLLAGRFPATSQPNEGLGNDILFDGGHLHYFTYRSLRLLLERSSFKILKAVGYGKFGSFHALYPPLLSSGVQWVATKPETIDS